MITIAVLFYNLIIICGTAYLVFERGFSGWWFLLAIVLCASGKLSNTTKK
jgi:hypothetical protein